MKGRCKVIYIKKKREKKKKKEEMGENLGQANSPVHNRADLYLWRNSALLPYGTCQWFLGSAVERLSYNKVSSFSEVLGSVKCQVKCRLR